MKTVIKNFCDSVVYGSGPEIGPETDVRCHTTRNATNQNNFIRHVSQNAGERNISRRVATFWGNVEQYFKGKSHNVFNKQYRAFLLLK